MLRVGYYHKLHRVYIAGWSFRQTQKSDSRVRQSLHKQLPHLLILGTAVKLLNSLHYIPILPKIALSGRFA
jgi:hypothetical protein